MSNELCPPVSAPSPDDLARDALADLAVCNAASPGPWLVRPMEHDDWGTIRAAPSKEGFFPPVAWGGAGLFCEDEHFHRHWLAGTDPYAANAAFIALARTALPAWIRRCMVAESGYCCDEAWVRIARLQTELDALRAEIALLRKQNEGHAARIAVQSELLAKRSEKPTEGPIA